MAGDAGTRPSRLSLVCLLALPYTGMAVRWPAQQLRRPTFHRHLPSFAQGPDLPTLREQINGAARELEAAVAAEDFPSACALRDRIRGLSTRDPQHRFDEISRALEAAVAVEDYRAAAELHNDLLYVKHHLPQFQLAGLWRGLYPHHGEEVIRIRYARDDPNQLVAIKVTGDAHVPRGEMTFTASLHNIHSAKVWHRRSAFPRSPPRSARLARARAQPRSAPAPRLHRANGSRARAGRAASGAGELIPRQGPMRSRRLPGSAAGEWR